MMAKEELATSTDSLVEDGNIEKIRDILFGVQVRDFEQKFAQLEEKFGAELGEVRGDIEKRLDKLEKTLAKDLETLKGRVDDEPFLRDDAIKNATVDIGKAAEDIDKRLSALDEKYTEGENEMRAQILQQSIMLMDALHKKESELISTIEQETQGLTDGKADRTAISELFAEMAYRLSDEKRNESE